MTLILVIDDDQSIRTAVQAWLQHKGMDVLLADSGAAGLRQLKTSAIDLAIVDIFMPDMDGLEIIQAFGQRTPRVPVIAMSGCPPADLYGAAPDFLHMAGRLGAVSCLRKPFRSHQLLAAIEACLGTPVAQPGRDARVLSTREGIAGAPQKQRGGLDVTKPQPTWVPPPPAQGATPRI